MLLNKLKTEPSGEEKREEVEEEEKCVGKQTQAPSNSSRSKDGGLIPSLAADCVELA